MRTYELVAIFDPALEVAQIEGDLRKFNDMIAANGVVRKWERWGKRRLAYEIKGRQYGYYVLAVFDVEAAQMAELDRSLRLANYVVRHLITIVDPKRVPEVDAESVRSLGARPEAEGEESEAAAVAPVEAPVAVEAEAKPAAPAEPAAPTA